MSTIPETETPRLRQSTLNAIRSEAHRQSEGDGGADVRLSYTELLELLDGYSAYEILERELTAEKAYSARCKQGCIQMASALSRICYMTEPPNEREVSEYDVHCNEELVVKRVAEMKATTQAILQTVACPSVEVLRDRYMSLLKKLNERDKPDGFESWEAYHKHIVELQSAHEETRRQLDKLKAMVARSHLEEVDGYILDPKDCKPTLMRSGIRVLRHKDALIREQQVAKYLQAHAATARKLAEAKLKDFFPRELVERLAKNIGILIADLVEGEPDPEADITTAREALKEAGAALEGKV